MEKNKAGFTPVRVKHLNPINSQLTLIMGQRSCCTQSRSVTVTPGDTGTPRSPNFPGSHPQKMAAAEEGASFRLLLIRILLPILKTAEVLGGGRGRGFKPCNFLFLFCSFLILSLLGLANATFFILGDYSSIPQRGFNFLTNLSSFHLI